MHCNYYKYLQVDRSAEQEVIEAAYKRLCKKYHPDICKESFSDNYIKKLNAAYEILKDPAKRKSYDKKMGFISNNNIDNSVSSNKSSKHAIACVSQYFTAIIKKDYHSAYELISKKDKEYINIDEFIHWQTAVSKVYNILDFNCTVVKLSDSSQFSNSSLKDFKQIKTNILEFNLLENQAIEQELFRMVINEDSTWKIFLGYQDIKILTKKYEILSDNQKLDNVINWWLQQSEKTDLLTGLPNENGFIEKIAIESDRYKRYGNRFSIAILNISLTYFLFQELGEQKILLLQKLIASLIKNRIRTTDFLGIGENLTYFLLFPETNRNHTQKAIISISKQIENFLGLENVCQFKISEYSGEQPNDFFDTMKMK